MGQFGIGASTLCQLHARAEGFHRRSPNSDSFYFASRLTLGASGAALNPDTDVVSLKIGTVATSIPAGSFTTDRFSEFAFKGLIDGVNVRASIAPKGSNGYQVKLSGTGASLTDIINPVPLTIGNNANSQSVTATITLPKPLKGLYINPFGQ